MNLKIWLDYLVMLRSMNRRSFRSDGGIVALKEIKIHNQEGLPFTAIREGQMQRFLSLVGIFSSLPCFYLIRKLIKQRW